MSDLRTSNEPREHGSGPPLPRGQARGPSTGSGRGLSRREFLVLGAGAGAAAALAACQPTAAPAPTGPAPTGPAAAPAAAPPKKLADTIVYAHTAMAPSFDPAYSLSNSGFMMARQIYDALVTFDESGKIIPQLATEWKRIDPTTMEFKLRNDVKFSNGEDFTAESVKWTIERLMSSKNPNHSSTKSRMGPLAGAEVVNSTTVRIKTKEPDPILLNRLVSLFMLPPKYGAQAGDDGIGKQPVGTGSFKGIELVPSQRMVLEAWDGSWRGPSKVKKATVLQFNEPAAMIAALRSGDVDILFRVEPDQAEGLKNDFNIATQSAGSATSASILQQNGAALKDKRVRQALNLAVNKEEFVKNLLSGYADILPGQLLEKGMLGYHEGLKAIPYEPDRAKALLREAGFANLSLTLGTSVSTRPITEGLAGYFQGVGIDAKVNVYEASVSTRNINTQASDHLYVFNRDYFHMRDYDIFGPNLALQEQPHFLNEEFKNLFIASRSELNEEKRAGIIKKMSEILYNEYGMVFLFVRHIITPYTKKIAKLPRHFDTATYLWEVEKEA